MLSLHTLQGTASIVKGMYSYVLCYPHQNMLSINRQIERQKQITQQTDRNTETDYPTDTEEEEQIIQQTDNSAKA